ncbi:hypothetical protein J6590_079072 [Homalodisca vitripennis]|nr:hypothetical protein J6590_079072 [Homalodisca vitripennis]
MSPSKLSKQSLTKQNHEALSPAVSHETSPRSKAVTRSKLTKQSHEASSRSKHTKKSFREQSLTKQSHEASSRSTLTIQ